MNITRIKVRKLLNNFTNKINLDDGKSFYLKFVRDLAGSGRFYDLIKFIEITIPNVRIFYLINLFIIIVFQSSS